MGAASPHSHGMSLWKSPILYIGIVLVLAVVAALAAPFVVDWNGYRANLEDYGKRLTGRTVKIEGPVAVQLFPLPSLTLQKVSVANPEGSADPHLMEADKIIARVTLAGLLNGNIHVESIDVVKPIFSLERLATGQGTWRLAPAADLSKSRLLEHVKLDQISLIDGAIRFADRRRGGVAVIEHISGALSAPSVAGPWRARLQANYAGSDLAIALSTGAWRADEALKFAFSVTPPEDAGFIYSFDGASDRGRITGTLRAEPQPVAEGKGDAVPMWRTLLMTAKVTSDFDQVALDDIEVVSRRADAGGTLVSGKAKVTLGPTIGIDARLAAPRLDLDAFAGDAAGALLRDTHSLAVLSDAIDALPDGIDGKLAVDIAALTLQGAVLENAKLEAALAEGALRIGKLSTKLPGQSAMLFDGVFLADPASPQLAGDLSVESGNLRDLTRWAAPEVRDAIGQYWKGNRGRLKAQTRLDISPGRLRLSESEFELDGAPGEGSLSIATGAKTAADIKLAIERADLDAFVAPGTITADLLRGTTGQFAAGVAALKVDFKTKALRLNGTEAANVAMNFSADERGLGIANLAIGAVEGAALTVSGNVRSEGGSAEGALKAGIVAEQPRGLLRFLGLIPADRQPAWVAALGATDLKADITLAPKDELPGATVHVAGQSGPLTLDGTLSLAGSLDWRNAEIAGVAELNAARGAAIARLAGLAPVAEGDLPGRLAVSLNGTLKDGMRAQADAEAFGATFGIDAKVNQGDGGLGLEGTARITAEDGRSLAAAMGCGGCGEGRFEAAADLRLGAGGLTIGELKGSKNAVAFQGELAVSPGLSLRGDISLGEMSLRDLLALALLRWDGGAPELDAPLTARLPFGLTGEVWLRPNRLQVFAGLEVAEAQVGLSAVPGETRLAIRNVGDDRQLVSLDLGARESRDGVALDGKISLPVELERQLRAAGQPVATGLMRIEAEFSGTGRSAASALANMKATGGYQLKGAHLAALDADTFLAAAETAESGPGLERALASLVGGNGIDIADRSGSISGEGGAISFLPVNLRTGRAAIVVTPTADIPSGVLSLDLAVSFDGPEAPPPLTVAYAGPVEDLTRTVNAGKTMSEFSMRILRKGVRELERLQREQEKAAAEEARQRAEDAARVAAWEAHRRELQRRQSEIRVHREMWERQIRQRELEAKQRAKELSEMNKAELDRRLRALRTARTMRRIDKTAAAVDGGETPVFGSETAPAPVPKPRAKPKPKQTIEDILGDPGLGIVLVPPDPGFSSEEPPKPKVRRNFNLR